MKLMYGNLLNQFGNVPRIAFTTNGITKINGEAVMGRGIALAIKKMFPGIAYTLGEHLNQASNMPSLLLKHKETELWSFPVKHHWKDPADLNLIEKSAKYFNSIGGVDVNAPGIGNGWLSWAAVESIIKDKEITVWRFK